MAPADTVTVYDHPLSPYGQKVKIALLEKAVAFDAPREAMEQGQFKREYRDHRLEWMIKSGGIQVVQEGLDKGNIRFIEPFRP
ncbi:MAG: hypothetical protein U5Q16_11200 [Gammaproteobacteria bacterium]|nr:hypothetical protein [Gammaproteobacteria bacterium]